MSTSSVSQISFVRIVPVEYRSFIESLDSAKLTNYLDLICDQMDAIFENAQKEESVMCAQNGEVEVEFAQKEKSVMYANQDCDDYTEEPYGWRNEDYYPDPPLTRLKRRSPHRSIAQDFSTSKRRSREKKAKKRSPRQLKPLKQIESSIDVETRALVFPYDSESRYRIQPRYVYSQHKCFYWTHQVPSYGWYFTPKCTRNFKAERKAERLKVQRKKFLFWQRMLKEYFPQFLPTDVHIHLLLEAKHILETSDASLMVHWTQRVEFYTQTLASRRA